MVAEDIYKIFKIDSGLKWLKSEIYLIDDLLQFITENQIETILSSNELGFLKKLTVLKRRNEWLSGRIASKQLLKKIINKEIPLFDISIERQEKGVPKVILLGGWDNLFKHPLKISISHCEQFVYCSAAKVLRGISFGIDVEKITKRDKSFLNDFFTEKEKKSILSFNEETIQELITTVWSLKESVLKALELGLTVPSTLVEAKIQKSLDSGFIIESIKINNLSRIKSETNKDFTNSVSFSFKRIKNYVFTSAVVNFK